MAKYHTLPQVTFYGIPAREQFDKLVKNGVAIDDILFYTTLGVSFKFNCETDKFELIKDETSKIEIVKYEAFASYWPKLNFDENEFRKWFVVRFTKEMS